MALSASLEILTYSCASPPSPRLRLHSEAAFDCGDEIEEAGVVSGELVVSGGDAPEVFDLVEEAFDQIAVFVERGVKASPLGGCGAAWDDGLGSGCRNGMHGTLAVIALVGEDMVGPQSIEQPLDLGDVVAFTAGQDKADRVAKSIGCGMNLGA